MPTSIRSGVVARARLRRGSAVPAGRPAPAARWLRRPSGGGGWRRRAVAAMAALVSLAAVSACDLAGAAPTPPQPKKGGTLYIVISRGLDYLDPQRTYLATAMDIMRLTTRTLTTYRSVPGAASQIVPDLATDTGRPSENNTIWKFTLKPNVKWQGGELVTCAQVKYGIERRFSPLQDKTGAGFDEGAPYPKSYLVDNDPPYQGPWLDNDNDGKGLESIKCLDQYNIEFHLTKPVGDFGYTLALTTFAPVIPEKDQKLEYTDHLYSNGPYKIVSRDDKQIVMERNNFWTETNDQVRKAYPDKIVFKFTPDDGGVVTNELIENEGEARNTVMMDGNVAPNFFQQVINDPDLAPRTLLGSTGAVRFMAINTTTIKNIACRQALIYAFDRRKWRAVNGGAVSGDYATTMIPPGFNGYKPFDLFNAIANPEGQPEKALAIMDQQQKAGKPCKSTIKLAYPQNSLRKRLVNTVVEAYQLAGIEVVPVPLDPNIYYSTGIGDPTNTYDLLLAGWIPDWAAGSAILPPLYAGSGIPKVNPVTGHAAGNVNFSMLNDPKINKLMDEALAETDQTRQAALWGDLDQQIQGLAVAIPILYEKAVQLTGSNVLGAFVHPAFGMPDLAALGLAQPSP